MDEIKYEVHGVRIDNGVTDKERCWNQSDAEDTYDGMGATGEYSEVKLYQVEISYREMER